MQYQLHFLVDEFDKNRITDRQINVKYLKMNIIERPIIVTLFVGNHYTANSFTEYFISAKKKKAIIPILQIESEAQRGGKTTKLALRMPRKNLSLSS